jgi:hypothetical protein
MHISQMTFFFSLRSFQLNQDKEPVYHLEIDEPSDEGRKIKAPNMALIDYTLPQFQSSPRSEIQYLSAMALKPSVTLIIHLNRLDLTNIDWETIVIDYLLIAGKAHFSSFVRKQRFCRIKIYLFLDKTSTADAGQLIYCPTLKSYVAADLYCLTPSSLTACPRNCSGISGFDSAVSRFDTNFFSYGSCGRERVSVKCGQTKEALHGRQTVNFILDWNVLGGILAGSVVLFILFPITILCVGYYRRKR